MEEARLDLTRLATSQVGFAEGLPGVCVGGEGVSPEGESQLETDFEHFLSVMMRTFV